MESLLLRNMHFTQGGREQTRTTVDGLTSGKGGSCEQIKRRSARRTVTRTAEGGSPSASKICPALPLAGMEAEGLSTPTAARVLVQGTVAATACGGLRCTSQTRLLSLLFVSGRVLPAWPLPWVCDPRSGTEQGPRLVSSCALAIWMFLVMLSLNVCLRGEAP